MCNYKLFKPDKIEWRAVILGNNSIYSLTHTPAPATTLTLLRQCIALVSPILLLYSAGIRVYPLVLPTVTERQWLHYSKSHLVRAVNKKVTLNISE